VGAGGAADTDTEISPARLPASSDPITRSIWSARAPPMVAMSSAVCAGTAVGSRVESLARNDAWRIASNISRSLLLAAPSVPRPTATPADRYLGIGAAPLASFMLLSGLCATPTACRFKMALSSSVTQTPCAASVFGPQNAIDSRYAAGVILYWLRANWISSSVSEKWMMTGTPYFRPSAADASRVVLSLV